MSTLHLLKSLLVIAYITGATALACDDHGSERPIPVSVVKPAYPPIAAARKISGSVRVEVEVDSKVR